MDALAQAILRTVAYADVFDAPLTEAEIHKYLIATPAGRDAVCRALAADLVPGGWLAVRDGHYALPGREATLAVRLRRAEISARLWPRAARYGRWIGGLPMVRMVAVTGSLAVDSADSQADLDYLIVTRPGRLWVTRALVVLLVRAVRGRGDTICPNYFLSEAALALPERTLFTAHEFVQMVPLVGAGVYRRMWALNGWVRGFLPNAGGLFWDTAPAGIYPARIRLGLERLLQAGAVSRLEDWEMRRKQAKFGRAAALHPEASFSPDVCKGHFDDHGGRILAAYHARLKEIEANVVEAQE
jgi:hypothetical protein